MYQIIILTFLINEKKKLQKYKKLSKKGKRNMK